MNRRPHLIAGAVSVALLAFGSVVLAQEASPSPAIEPMSPSPVLSPGVDDCPTPPVMASPVAVVSPAAAASPPAVASPAAMASPAAVPSLDGNGSSSLELCPSPAPSGGALPSAGPLGSPGPEASPAASLAPA